MDATLAHARRRIALVLGIFLSLTIAGPALADASGGAVSAPILTVQDAICIALAPDGVEWTLVDTAVCIDGPGPLGVEWT